MSSNNRIKAVHGNLEPDCCVSRSLNPRGTGIDIASWGHKFPVGTVTNQRGKVPGGNNLDSHSSLYCRSTGSFPNRDLECGFKELQISDGTCQSGREITASRTEEEFLSPEHGGPHADLYAQEESNVAETFWNWDVIFQKDPDGDTQLHIAIMMETQLDFVLSIVNFCPNVQLLHIPNHLFQTPLHLAVLTRQTQVVKALLSRGILPVEYDQNGDTALHLACQLGDAETVHAFTHGFHMIKQERVLRNVIHHKNYSGLTCCHLAAMSQVADILFHFIQDCDADVNIQEGKRGLTVLHLASESNKVALVAFLLFLPNIDLNRATYDGWTALDLAVGRNLVDVEKLLELAGARASRSTTESGSESDASVEMDDEKYEDL